MAPIYDPMTLNIGINCQWQPHCQRQQTKAMNDARKFIAAYDVPLWRIHVCNKNARRGPARLDWVGFNSCIRNPQLVPPPDDKTPPLSIGLERRSKTISSDCSFG